MKPRWAFDAGRSRGSPGAERLPMKHEIPPLPPIYVVRQRLLTLLNSVSRARLTSITGPPGSGKTSLTSWLVRAGMAPGSVAWVTLDSGDNSPGAFWYSVLDSLRRHIPDLDRDLPAPVPSSRFNRSAIAALAARLSSQSAPVLLILDRTETVHNRMITSDLDLLLQYSTPGIRLVTVGRSADLIPIHRYRLAGELVEIGSHDLSLTADESTEIIRAHGVSLSPAEATAVHEWTEGWMTGVCLHARAWRPGTGSTQLPDANGRQAVTNYLRTEVLDAQPARVRDLLLRTSILDEVDPDLADRLTGHVGARGILNNLARANAFVTPLDASRFRYQTPLRTVLADELTTRHTDLARRLHDRAAHWYAGQQSVVPAVDHAVKAGEWEYAAQVTVGQLGVTGLLSMGLTDPPLATLSGLPDGSSGPAVDLLRSVLALVHYDTAGARAAADRATARTNSSDLPSAVLLLEAAAVDAIIARRAGDIDAAEAAAAEMMARRSALPPEMAATESRTHALILSNLGIAQFWAGRSEDAYATLGQVAASTGHGTEYAVHDALGHLAMMRLYEGKLREADRYAHESLAVADRAGIPSGSRVGAASATLATVALVWNDLPTVRAHASQAIATSGARHDPPTAVTIALLRAWVACARHDGRRAIDAVNCARAFISRRHPSPLIVDRIELTAIWAHLILGDTVAARTCVDRISDPSEQTLAHGYLLEAEGNPAAARRVLSSLSPEDALPTALQYAAIALGRLALSENDRPAATRALRQALEYGRPERRRRPLTNAGSWIGLLLRENPEVAAEHPWLTASPNPAPGETPVVEPLTDREVEVLRCMMVGLSTVDIATSLRVSANTIKTHLKNIYRKLGTSGRSATAKRARELNLLPATETNPTQGDGGGDSRSVAGGAVSTTASPSTAGG
jgi:LuxR family maltose regulon positive regulatory protein